MPIISRSNGKRLHQRGASINSFSLRLARGNLYGLSEQLLLSGTSFFTIIILARYSTAGVVGRASFILNILTLFLLIHKSIGNAYTVFTAGEVKKANDFYLREFILIHLPIIVIVLFCLFAVSILLFYNGYENILYVNLSIILIGTSLIYEAQRRILWAAELGHKALSLALMRSLVFCFGLFVIKTLNLVFSFSVALYWMISTRMVSFPSIIQNWSFSRNSTRRPIKAVFTEYWNFSRWILLMSILSYIAGNIYVPIVVSFLGFEKAGEFEIGRQLVAPFYILPMGIFSFLLPQLAKNNKALQRHQYKRQISNIMKIWMLSFLALSGLFILLGRNILDIFIGKRSEIYNIYSYIPILAILGYAISLNILSEAFITAIERPQLGWRPMGVAAFANAIIGVPLVLKFGVPGAFTGNAITSTVSAAMILRYAFKYSNKPNEE